MAVDSAGDVFIADTDNNCIREINHATSLMSIVAGTGAAGYSGDGGPATAARLSHPYGLAFDASRQPIFLRRSAPTTFARSILPRASSPPWPATARPATAATADTATAAS